MTSIVIIVGTAVVLFAAGYLVGFYDRRNRLFRSGSIPHFSGLREIYRKIRRIPPRFERYDILLYTPRRVTVHAINLKDARKRALEQCPQDGFISVVGKLGTGFPAMERQKSATF